MRISDWSSDVCSSDLNRDCTTGERAAHTEVGAARRHRSVVEAQRQIPFTRPAEDAGVDRLSVGVAGHDHTTISDIADASLDLVALVVRAPGQRAIEIAARWGGQQLDRKSTRLNSSP